MQIVRLFSFIICLTFIGTSFAQDSTIKVIEAYPLSDISVAFEKSEKELRSIQEKLENSQDIEEFFLEFHEILSKSIMLRSDTSRELIKNMSLNSIKDLSTEWARYSVKINRLEEKVSKLNQSLEKQKEKLSVYEKRWQLTQISTKEREVAEVVNVRITKNIGDIKMLDELRKNKQGKCFLLLDSLTEEKLLISDINDLIADIENELKANIFSLDSPPYFQMTSDSIDTLGVIGGFSFIWKKTQSNNIKFIADNKNTVWLHGLIYLLFVLLFFLLRNECAKVELNEIKTFKFFTHFVNSPFISALVFALFISFWLYPNRPGILTEQLLLLIVFPLTVLLSGLYKSVFRFALLALGLLFLLEQLQYFVSGQVLLYRNLLMVEGLIGLIVSVYLSFPKTGFIPRERTKNWLIVKLFPLIPLLFFIAIYQNIQGSVQLSKMITSVLIKSTAIAVILYSVVMFLEGFVELIVSSEFGKKSFTVRDKSDILIRWTKIILGVWAIYKFLRSVMIQTRMDGSFNSWWDELKNYGWEFGDASLTVGTILSFVLIIIVFSIIANVSRSLLEFELLPRFDVKKGVPMAVGVVTRYFILVLGFFMAVAAAGIDMDKLGFLAGALGVGIGFGLQHVVNNFVSGLILVFERPIHIDDVITAGEIEGVVQEIGIRASKIKTWDGAEVIVPNSDLVSFKVTNWTFSDTKRRREHRIKVETGNDPNVVITRIKDVFEKNANILKDPSPMVLFLGQTGYSLEFRMLYWISASYLLADSELALEIYNDLNRAGIKMAIPKQSLTYEDSDSVKKVVTPKKATGRQ